MMGQQGGGQDSLFYAFNLDDHVPRDHPLRGIDHFFDAGDLRQHLAPFYSHTGRPSIDPELIVRMLLVGYCFGIRSERRLCEEVHLNLAYRWFCHLGLDDAVPNHSTFSKNRHGRFRDSDTLRHVFESVLRRCMSEGLVGGEGFAVDASVVKADANRARGAAGIEGVDWSALDRPSRAVREYLKALDESAVANDSTSPETEPETPPKKISLTDPAARYTAAPGGPACYAYSTNYLIDLQAGIIVDVEATPAHRSQEVESTKTMIDRVEERFHLRPERLVGDTAYGTGKMLGWMVEEKGIEPHVPVWQRAAHADNVFPNSDFDWIEQANEYRCPGGHALRSNWRAFKNARTHVTKEDTVIYRSSQHDCAECSMKNQCCPDTPRRKITRSVHEAARDHARAIATTPQYKRSRRERKKVEMLFAHLKRILRLDRLRLRGLSGAHDEFLLAATAQNLRRMAKRLMWGSKKAEVATA
ncbi:transposase [Paraburkholderia sabiae]|uniref:IS1182 family transposase n=1 Tax=Paraburkholderia sabiae TaxID=273251 RepID=A0ABU9QRY4_9BURK|nr:transposase [Paraburkholderia sabiae]WJZ72189.1 IS1182 family transposase [Paraburkholderia sabiae]CAD6563112.1 IS1182 family transposase ISPsp5 [Paraburkholderia sabiae]